MKKISGFLITLLLVITLVGCGKNRGLTKSEEKNILTISEFDVMRRKLNYELKLDDPKGKLKGRTFTAKITYGKTEMQSLKLEINEADEDAPKDLLKGTFKSLSPDHKYTFTVSVTLVVKGNVKTYTLINKEFTTMDIGSTIDNPVLINTVEEFLEIGTLDADEGIVYYRLMEDLDFSEYDPEASKYNHTYTASSKFKGVFDGNGKTIKNFVINERKTYMGLFPYNEGTIKNLTVENGLIELMEKNQSSQYIGFIAGRNAGTIDNVKVINSEIKTGFNLTNKTYIGGLVGKGESGTVIEKATVDNVKFDISTESRSEYFLGGVVGYLETGTLEKAKSNVDITLNHAYTGNVGGVAGLITNNTKVKEVEATTSLKVTTTVRNLNSTVKPYDRIEVAVGGAFGKIEDKSTIESVFVKSTIEIVQAINNGTNQSPSDKYLVGGLVGVSVSNSTIKEVLTEATILLGTKVKEENEQIFKGMDNIYAGGIAGQMSHMTYEKLFASNTEIIISKDYGTYNLSPTVGLNSSTTSIDFNEGTIRFDDLVYTNTHLTYKDEEPTEVVLLPRALENYFAEDSFIGKLLNKED